MSHPLVIAYHLIWTGYGLWLPNDPRGGGSTVIRRDVLAELGELHFGRKRLQPSGNEIRAFYAQAIPLLQHSQLPFDRAARHTIGEAFGKVIEEQRYTCYACAIMSDHVHLLIRKHKQLAEEMTEFFKSASKEFLQKQDPRLVDHPIWASGNGWKVFLDHPDEVWRTIRYIEANPGEVGIAKQEWGFVTRYDNWPLHAGHSPNSLYARRLREQDR